MKIFSIQEKNEKVDIVGYLFYYEKSKEFHIELLDNLDEWNIPLLLSSLYKKGIRTIDSYESKEWVRQRIIPFDRQNIGEILRKNKLNNYDEFNMLMLSCGRCEQDNFYLESVLESDLPKEIKDRFSIRVDDILPLENKTLVVFFRNGSIKLFDCKDFFNKNKTFDVIEKNNCFDFVKIIVGGYGIYWDNNLSISNETLFEMGKNMQLSNEVMRVYMEKNVLSTADIMRELNCSRQYVNELVKNGKLHPIKSFERNTLFLKKEVEQISWY